ncbi:phage tail protein [Lelliottia amnigena]|uniref:tail fiber protein n=1 Tax=Lelliottia amnigena TaxID=61646 RepID=UPI001F38FD14|nr:tail fiber protein [Lelliottia amnigena]MCE9967234.1 phage tail protein [Lelliottia amnigena]
MSQTAITLAFEQWKASQAVTGEAVLLDEFVFASVPGLDINKPIDRNETLPPAAQIVHRQAVSRKGVVNDNAVVHSVVLGAEVGDFSFNWVGLINKASNTLAMIVHAPVQQKLKTKDGQQGNVLTRSFLMEYDGAQVETGISTPAETWQIDFTARMTGIDERQRQENIDLYGAAAFLGDGWLVAKKGSQFFVTAGAGYVRGLRAQLAANQNITVAAKPVKVWLDVTWTGTLTSAWSVTSKITQAANLADYVQNGVQHYVFAVASIDAEGNITDLRPKGTLNDQTASDALKKHEQSRNHPDATTSVKGFTQLSSATDSESEGMAATPKAVKAVFDLATAKYTAQDATTGQKGIVQLSSSLASTSETQAATPKAVKAVNDELVKVRDSLGTASKANVVTSMSDTTAGRVPVVGWLGLGGGARDTNVSKETIASFWRDTSEAKSGITLPYDGTPATNYFGIDGANHHAYIGRQKSGEGIAWVKLYSEFNKPTAEDVDAVSASQGGTFQKGIAVKGNGATVALWPLAAGQSSYLLGKDYNGDNLFYFGRGSDSYHVSLYNYKGNSGIILGWEGSISLNPDAGKSVVVNNGPLKASTEIQSSNANSFRIAYGNYGTFWRNDGANLYLMLTKSGDAWGGYGSLRPLTVNLSTGRVSVGHGLNATGQVVPSDYGNFDALYQRKTATVIDVRQGSPGTIVLKRNGWNYVPGGCAFTGWYVEGDAPVDDTIQYKPLQININGAWRTISG